MADDIPLKILALLDGKPGHEKQTKGVLNALASITPVRIEYRNVPAPTLFSKMGEWLHYFYHDRFGGRIGRKDSNRTGSVDFIIGTGTQTHIMMLLEKKERGAKVLTCMSPSPFLINKFDLCFVPQHDNLAPMKNIFFTQGPPNTSPYSEEKDNQRGLILVGGIDRKSHVWKSDETLDQIRTILDRDPSKAWTVGTSPRTPEGMNHLLEDLAGNRSRVDFFRPKDTSSGWIEEQYKKNGFVWVTADSISMIYEPITAGCQVGILPVEWKRKDSKFHRSIAYVLSQGLAVSYEQWLRNGWIYPATRPRLDEATRCAEEILKRWWPKRLR
jgi:mitochondrial fission protein ELM1